MKTIPTVAIKTKEGERLVINESDFDINRHQLWIDEEIQPENEETKGKESEKKDDKTGDESPQKTRGAKRQAKNETE